MKKVEWEIGMLPTDADLYREYEEEEEESYFSGKLDHFYNLEQVEEFMNAATAASMEDLKSKTVKKGDELELEEIKKYFDMPISEAAKKLKLSLTVLKARCRKLKIERWPQRKIKSIISLLNNIKDLELEKPMDVERMLMEERIKIQQLPDLQLSNLAIKIRQKSVKATYNKKIALASTYLPA